MVKLAGNETVGTFSPDQLYAGEADIVSTQATVANGQNLVEGQVVALVGGELIAYDKENVVAGSNVPYGIMPHDVNATGGAKDSPVFIGGVFNFDKLTADAQTYAGLRAAFATSNANIVIQKLY